MARTTYKNAKSRGSIKFLGTRMRTHRRMHNALPAKTRKAMNREVARLVSKFGQKRTARVKVPAALRGLNTSLIRAATTAIAHEQNAMTNVGNTRRSGRIAVKKIAEAERKAAEEAKRAIERAAEAERKAEEAKRKAAEAEERAQKKAAIAQKKAETLAMYDELTNLMTRQMSMNENMD